MLHRRALSLIEVLVVVVILGLVAAFAVPRLGRAAPSQDPGVVLRSDLKVLRLAIERYYQDHGTYPGQVGDGVHAAGTADAVVAQLTRPTNAAGSVQFASNEPCFGPYLRDGVPACPVPPRAGATGVSVVTASGTPPTGEDSAGWRYHCTTGAVSANSDERDRSGQEYDTY